jgi:hypothetical protein
MVLPCHGIPNPAQNGQRNQNRRGNHQAGHPRLAAPGAGNALLFVGADIPVVIIKDAVVFRIVVAAKVIVKTKVVVFWTMPAPHSCLSRDCCLAHKAETA